MLISQAWAQGATGGSGDFLVQLFPLILIFVVFYFLLIRPQQKKAKDHRAMIEAVKRGDVVVTTGGLIGKIVHVDGNELGLEIAPNVRIKQMKGMIAEVRAKTEPGSATAAPPPKPARSEEPAGYYKTLGLKADASAAEIAAAAAAKSNDAAAVEAFETLGDATRRKLYDRLGHEEYVATVKG